MASFCFERAAVAERMHFDPIAQLIEEGCMSNYNQVGQGKPDQEQQGNKLGAGQSPSPKPGLQTELPDQSNQNSQSADEPSGDSAPSLDNGLPHQLPGGEGG